MERPTSASVSPSPPACRVGTLCPFVSENGAVATQSLVNVDLGRRGLEYIDDGLAVQDVVRTLAF